MSNIQQILNVEIRRLARKEAKEAVKPLKERIKKLHLQVRTLKTQVRLLAAGKPIDQPAKDEAAEPAKIYRVDGKRIRRIRQKIRVNQTDFAKLLGVSLKTIVNWEKGYARPRQPMKVKIVELSRADKKEISARIQELEK
ncbi:MAG: helix-turn-helix transcriptional regulator [Thermoguttaceae bacterium]|nr:helix-turn-helix transcriptional regulator [Thermoguttaceae bacterium]